MPFVKKFNRNASRRFLAVVALFVVFLMVVSSIFVYYTYFLEEEKFEEKIEENMVIDNHISPLENQALILELKRIRHRGFYDLLLTKSCAWRNIPSFYFVVELDGLEYKSKDVEHLGTVVEILYDTWDSMFQENKIVRDAEEEQETSAVKVTIVERVKTGLLKRKTTDIERDSFTVEYDYRTGRWHGDDYFMDEDGYGYYLGDTFEVWFNIYQNDYDCDYIPYWVEANILGTDPRRSDVGKDPDGDGIDTFWEWKWGYDPFTWDDHDNLDPDLDGLDNLEEYQMRQMFADPFIQNIYYEVDYMGRGGLFDPPHYFYEETGQAVIERFAQHNIKLLFDDGWPNSPANGGGQELPHIAKISQDSGMMLQFYNNYFPDERKGIFRYFVVGHGGGFQHPSKNNIYDTTHLGVISTRWKPFIAIKWLRDFVVTGTIPTERGKRCKLASLLLHEMAHSCSIDADNCNFAGIDNISYGLYILPNKQYKATWGQYHSVLNYFYANNPKTMDLSSGENGPPYDQNDWGFMFVGYFQYNSNLIEEPYYEAGTGETLVRSEFRISDYTFDANLTDQFEKYIGEYSPLDPIKVNWSVYRIIDKEKNPNLREVKIFAQPAIKTTNQWVFNREADLDAEGNLVFYSYEKLLEEKLK